VRQFDFDEMSILIYITCLQAFLCCHYDGNVTYIDESTIFLNATRDMSFKDTKKIIGERLELNYNCRMWASSIEVQGVITYLFGLGSLKDPSVLILSEIQK
jgi:hypothetical protein